MSYVVCQYHDLCAYITRSGCLLSSDRCTLDSPSVRPYSLPSLPSQSDILARGRAANHSPQSPRDEPTNSTISIIRSELNATRAELQRYRSDATRLAEMYRAALEEANEALRSRDKQIEHLKREIASMANRNSRRRSVRDTPPDDSSVDVFEGHSFNDRHSIIVVGEEGAPGKEKPEGAGQDGEFDPEKVHGSNDLTEWSILITEALQSPTSPIQRRLPEPPPTHTNANMAPLPNAAPIAIPDIPTQVPAPPPTFPIDVVANATAAAFAPYRHDQHQSFQPKRRRRRANVVRAGPKKTGIPASGTDHHLKDDRNEEDVDNIHGEGFDNYPRNPVNVDSENHNGPRSIKTVSHITCC